MRPDWKRAFHSTLLRFPAGSLQSLKHNHQFLSPVMSEEFISTYRILKMETQVLPDQARPTPFEFLTTYSA